MKRPSRSSRCALLLCASVATGCAPGDTSASVVGLEIVDGAPSSDPTVVAVVRRRLSCEDDAAAVVCSGVLIAPRVVLTVGHCLDDVRVRGELEVYFGDEVGAGGTFVMVAATASDPARDPVTSEHDVALLALERDAPVAPRAPSAVSVDALAAGTPLRVVGYGGTSPRDSELGVQREGTMTLGEIRATSFDAAPGPAMSCRGDSGGPVFAMIDGTEELVGITVRGDPGCRERAFQVRIDAVLETFVDPFVASVGELPAAWPDTAVGFDDVGEHECAGDEECPALMHCTENPTGGSRCALPGLGSSSFTAACATDAECGGDESCVRLWPDGPDACRCARAAVMPPPLGGGGDGGCSASHARRTALVPGLALLACVVLRRRRASRRDDRLRGAAAW